MAWASVALVVLGVVIVAGNAIQLQQRKVDAWVRSQQTYRAELGKRVPHADKLERLYRWPVWANLVVGIVMVVVGTRGVLAAIASA